MMFKKGQFIRLKQRVPPPCGYEEYYTKHRTPLSHISKVINDQRPGNTLVMIQLVGVDTYVTAAYYELCIPSGKKLEDYM